MENEQQRKSVALDAELITDPQLKAEAEARNGLRQFDLGIEIISAAISNQRDGRAFKLRPSLILSLQRTALEGISAYAGNYRPADVRIEGSKHEPMPAYLVAEAIEDLCDYVNEKWEERTPIHWPLTPCGV